MSNGLDTNLVANSSPSNSPTSSLEFNSQNDRGAVGDYNLGTINASKITVGTLSGTVAYLGTLTANQINGGTLILGGTSNGDGVLHINNASGTTIIQGNNTGHHYYNTVGAELIRGNDSGLYGFGTVEQVVTFQDSASGTIEYGYIGFSAGSQSFFLQSRSGRSMYALSAGNFILSAGTQLSALCNSMYLTSDTSATIQAPNRAELAATGSGSVVLSAGGAINGTAGGDINLVYGGDFKLNGSTKTAVVPTSIGYNELYCMESPEVWFMDFCSTKESVDPLFLEVTEPPYKFIKCDPDGFQVWGKRKEFSNKRFEQVTELDYITNNKFWSFARPQKDIK